MKAIFPMMKTYIAAVALVASLLASPQSQSQVLYAEDFSSGWTYGSTVVGQKAGWLAGNSSYQDDFTPESGTPDFLSYEAGGVAKNLSYNPGTIATFEPGEAYVFSALIRNDDIGAVSTGNRGILGITFQGTGGRALGRFEMTVNTGTNSTVRFDPGAGFATAPTTQLTLNENLAAGIWYSIEMTLIPSTDMISFAMRNTSTDALVASASGALTGESLNATSIRSLYFYSGTFGAEATVSRYTNLQIEAIPEPGYAGILSVTLLVGFLRRKRRSDRRSLL